ncbi:MAG: alpha/beta fold hydrolase [Desulfococcaceae bacterium]
MNPKAYLIPGRDEGLGGQLGSLLRQEGRDVRGRALRGEFARMRFPEQLAEIRWDLADGFWTAEGVLVGRSYGAYLLLHVLAEEEAPFPGRALLLSPVLGPARRIAGRLGSRPPRADRLRKMAAEGTFPPPAELEIHTGAEDQGCDPDLAREIFQEMVGVKLVVVPEMGHELDPEYVWRAARRFLRGDG